MDFDADLVLKKKGKQYREISNTRTARNYATVIHPGNHRTA